MYHNVMGGFSVQLKVPEPKQKPDAVPQLPVITMHLQGYSRWRQEDSWKSRSWGTQPGIHRGKQKRDLVSNKVEED